MWSFDWLSYCQKYLEIPPENKPVCIQNGREWSVQTDRKDYTVHVSVDDMVATNGGVDHALYIVGHLTVVMETTKHCCLLFLWGGRLAKCVIPQI